MPYAQPGADLALCNAVVAVAGSERRMPTGFVSFSIGGELLAVVPLKTDGVATLALPRSALKGQGVVASYVGDGNFRSSRSAPASAGAGQAPIVP